MSDEMQEKLFDLLEDLKDWEKKDTDVPGVKIIRIPENKYNTKPARLALEIIPVDEEGRPKKRKGLVITNLDLFLSYSVLFKNEKVNTLMEEIDAMKLIREDQQDETVPGNKEVFKI